MKKQYLFPVLLAITLLAACGGSGGGGSSPGSTSVDIDTMAEADISIEGKFTYTFSEAVSTSTVSDSTFFITSLSAGGEIPETSLSTKATYDPAICMSENTINAAVACSSSTTCTLTPAVDLDYLTDYAICLTTDIALASGSSFSGHMSLFTTEAGTEECDNSAITTYTYLMTFQACTDGDSCSNPQYHKVYMAGSNDGVTWTMIDAFEPISGSVPDLVFYNDFLYLFHTQGTTVQKLNACFETVSQRDMTISGTDVGWVDPSLITSDDDLILFYLPKTSASETDVAGCGDDYPCTKYIHSAVADNSLMTSFIQQETNVVSMELDPDSGGFRTFSDPDIIEMNDGTYLLYMSAGQNTLVYESASLSTAFTVPNGESYQLISDLAGGVPGALVAPDGSVWVYVTTNNDSGDGTTIRKGDSSDGKTEIDDAAFATAIDESISDSFDSETTIGSPSVIYWPSASEWSKAATSSD